MHKIFIHTYVPLDTFYELRYNCSDIHTKPKAKLDYTKFKTKSTYFGHVKTIKRFLCSRESYCCKKILTKICVPNIFMFYAKALE